MANLCGANEAIDNALSKVDDLIREIDSKIDLAASETAAALNNKLTDLKSALDGFIVDLPAIPDVNIQAEITGLISNIDKTTIQGLASFNFKVAQLKLDFGDTLTELGLDLDELIVSATDLISGGGDICALIPNLDIPASASGTGITTKEVEERASTANITLTQIPKSIVSVQGRFSGTNFFSNINYKQTGLVILPNELGYAEIKVTYLISLVKEKAINSKHADKKEEIETESVVITNTNALESKQSFDLSNLLSKVKSKGILGLATEKEKQGLADGIAALNSPTEKTKFQDALDKQNAFINGTGPNSMTGQFTSALNGPVDSTGKQSTIKVTTPKDASTVTTEKVTKVNPTSQKLETVEVTKTKKSNVSSSGFTNRTSTITEEFYTSSLPAGEHHEHLIDIEGFKLIEKGNDLNLKHIPVSIVEVLAREYRSKNDYTQFLFQEGQLKGSGVNNIIPALVPPKNLILIPKSTEGGSTNKINAVIIIYTYLEKLDPSVKDESL